MAVAEAVLVSQPCHPEGSKRDSNCQDPVEDLLGSMVSMITLGAESEATGETAKELRGHLDQANAGEGETYKGTVHAIAEDGGILGSSRRSAGRRLRAAAAACASAASSASVVPMMQPCQLEASVKVFNCQDPAEDLLESVVSMMSVGAESEAIQAEGEALKEPVQHVEQVDQRDGETYIGNLYANGAAIYDLYAWREPEPMPREHEAKADEGEGETYMGALYANGAAVYERGGDFMSWLDASVRQTHGERPGAQDEVPEEIEEEQGESVLSSMYTQSAEWISWVAASVGSLVAADGTPVSAPEPPLPAPTPPAAPRCCGGCLQGLSPALWFRRREKRPSALPPQTWPRSGGAQSSTAVARKPSLLASWRLAPVDDALQAGRLLEAGRLLDDLGSDAMELPDVENVMRQIAAAREALHLFAELPRLAELPNSGWETLHTPEARLFYKYDWNTGFLEAFGEVNFEFPALHLWAILREFDLFPLWSQCVELVTLATFTKETVMYYVRSDPVLSMFSPSEMYVERTYVDALDEHGCMAVLNDSPPLTASEYRGVALGPPCAGCNRISWKAEDVVVPVSSTRCIYKLHRKVHTHVPFLPNGIVGVAASAFVFGRLTAVQNLADKWDEGVFSQRMASGPRAADYALLRSRMDSVIVSETA